MPVSIDTRYLEGFIGSHELGALQGQVNVAHELLHEGTGLGSDFLGWLTLPTDYDKTEISRIKNAAARIQKDTDVFVVIGIGGSYLGARAAIEFLKSPLYNQKRKNTPDIYFAGNSISSSALAELLELCEGRRLSINVISKSGTTTEPAIAFRVFRDFLERTVGAEEAKKRIYITTDKARGTLKELSDREGFETFVVPDDVGGRFSVLTAVGLLPIAVAGCDIDGLMKGAAQAQQELSDPDLSKNDCYRYAAVRNILLRKGRAVELMVSYEPNYAMMSEWWKQLYGESEGKDGKGLFPASVVFSTDLHSLGQFVQDGSNILFETVVLFDEIQKEIMVKEDKENADGLNFLAGRTMEYINQKAFEGTVLAHSDGGTPNIVLRVPAV
ncbi:MAG: glucose-6-phosphate isomerase, partial [Oscillospiraceae bacterium]|nr:glucose-6-phosphate isomerase [Oscillospiraceae bacterium]